ncbi:unnamed protein product, partial [Meganyctiphanes norvegica]
MALGSYFFIVLKCYWNKWIFRLDGELTSCEFFHNTCERRLHLHNYMSKIHKKYVQEEASPNEASLVPSINKEKGNTLAHDDAWDSIMSERFKSRRKILDEACSKHKDFNSKIPGRPISMKMASNILLCHIPKVGSSTWIKHLSKINQRKSLEPHHYFSTSIVSDYLKSLVLDSSSPLFPAVRVITVRPPLERLVSCYRDKYAGGDNITLGVLNPWETAILYGRFHVPLMKSNNMKILKKHDLLSVTFEQFVRHITKAKDCHWRPYYNQCSPCLYNYDYITHLTEFEEDLKYIYQKAKVEEDQLGFGAKVRESSAGGPKPSSPESMFENLPIDLLQKIHKIYRMDFLLFGFEMPSFLQQFEMC